MRAKSPSRLLHASSGDPLWLLILPPALTCLAAAVLLLMLGSGTWADAQTWPHDFRATIQTADPKTGGGVCRAFVFITALLVVLNNTVLYLREIKRVSEEARPNSPYGRRERSLAFWLGLAATLLVCFWLVDTVLSLVPANTVKHESFALVAFLLFGVIDLSLARNAKRTASDGQKPAQQARLEAEAEYYGHQASYIDAAVVVGMLVLLFLKRVLAALPAFNKNFEWGFVTGAIGMHLAYSQFVFLALTMRYRKLRKQIAFQEEGAALRQLKIKASTSKKRMKGAHA